MREDNWKTLEVLLENGVTKDEIINSLITWNDSKDSQKALESIAGDWDIELESEDD